MDMEELGVEVDIEFSPNETKRIKLCMSDIGVDYLSNDDNSSNSNSNSNSNCFTIPGFDYVPSVNVNASDNGNGISKIFVDPVAVTHVHAPQNQSTTRPDTDTIDNGYGTVQVSVSTSKEHPGPGPAPIAPPNIHVGSKIVGYPDEPEQIAEVPDLGTQEQNIPSSACEFCNKADRLISELQERIKVMEANWADFGYPIPTSNSDSDAGTGTEQAKDMDTNTSLEETVTKMKSASHEFHCSNRQTIIDLIMQRIQFLQNQWTSIIDTPTPTPAEKPAKKEPTPTFAKTPDGVTIFYKTPCTCTICFDKFPTPHLVTEHFREFHQIFQVPVFCVPECGYAFRSKFKKSEHIKKAHKGLPCKWCEKVLINQSSLEMHVKAKHPNSQT